MPPHHFWDSELCDAHVHVGGHDRWYFSPEQVTAHLLRLGVKKWAVSSMSTPATGYSTAVRDIEQCLSLAPRRAVPLLWVTPAMLRASRDLSRYSEFPYAGIKVHGFDGWYTTQNGLHRLCAIAAERRLPLFVHTGGARECEAGAYSNLCGCFPDVQIVLCHGRPVEQAIDVCARHLNAWIETSFMPVGELRRAVETLGIQRILFGSDFPMDVVWYPHQSPLTRYRRRVRSLCSAFGSRALRLWSQRNFMLLLRPHVTLREGQGAYQYSRCDATDNGNRGLRQKTTLSVQSVNQGRGCVS